MYSVFGRYPCMAINDILYSILVIFFPPYIFLFTQAPILVWLDGTIIDMISTILVTMYYSGYVGL